LQPKSDPAPDAAPVRPSEEEERKALSWLVDVRANSGFVLERMFADSIIRTLAYFEWASTDDLPPEAWEGQ
jgi:hypothetical protein